MPLARIFCRSQKDAIPLIDRLSALGYEVETALPGYSFAVPADLEVELEHCSAEEALDRAEAFAQFPDAQVVVAPGALPERHSAIKRALAAFAERCGLAWREAVDKTREKKQQWGGSRAKKTNMPTPPLRSAAGQDVAPAVDATPAEIARRNREAEEEVLRMAEAAWNQLAAPVPQLPVTVPRVPRPVRRAPVSRRGREWRIATVTAALVAVLLMGAWSLARQPRPAAPLTTDQIIQGTRMEQSVPFGPVKLTNAPVVAAAQPAITKPPVRSAPAKPRAARTQKRTRKSAGYVAEDQVTVHGVRPAPTATPVASTVKRFSDSN